VEKIDVSPSGNNIDVIFELDPDLVDHSKIKTNDIGLILAR
jgi:hypothetical protein